VGYGDFLDGCADGGHNLVLLRQVNLSKKGKATLHGRSFANAI